MAVAAQRIADLARDTAGPATDREMNARIEGLFTASVNLVQAPSRDATDLDRKLTVLCQRLREFLDPDDHGRVLTYVLAETIRDEHRILATPKNLHPAKGVKAGRPTKLS